MVSSVKPELAVDQKQWVKLFSRLSKVATSHRLVLVQSVSFMRNMSVFLGEVGVSVAILTH